MPELPEVEVSMRAIAPFLLNQTIKDIKLHCSKLRWEIDETIPIQFHQAQIIDVSRRAKYIVIKTTQGSLIIHLGMSGCLKIITDDSPLVKHDHVEIITNKACIRLHDPRRFGAFFGTTESAEQHPRLQKLGPEPLAKLFNTNYLLQKIKQRTQPIKTVLMNNDVVVGVGNIYAQESLFLSGIDPRRAANSLSHDELSIVVKQIKSVLRKAIKLGGTTLKDFKTPNGKLGYFKQALSVYGRATEPCIHCMQPLESVQLQGRSTVYCAQCQQ